MPLSASRCPEFGCMSLGFSSSISRSDGGIDMLLAMPGITPERSPLSQVSCYQNLHLSDAYMDAPYHQQPIFSCILARLIKLTSGRRKKIPRNRGVLGHFGTCDFAALFPLSILRSNPVPKRIFSQTIFAKHFDAFPPIHFSPVDPLRRFRIDAAVAFREAKMRNASRGIM